MQKKSNRSGFTLVELIVVVAILALIASIAIGKFGDLRAASAKKVNLVNMQVLTRAANTYIAASDVQTGIFDKMESLLDVDGSGKWTGAQNTYDWTKNNMGAIPGIYMGPKSVSQISDAGGGGQDTTGQGLEEQRKQNQGIPAALVGKLGVYYLGTNDVIRLKEAGISNYLLHNYLAGQSSLFGFTENEDGTALENGGPGFRADMTAFYKVSLTNGSPVAVLDPVKSVAIYRAFGIDLGIKPSESVTTESFIAAQRLPYRLFCFGLGRTAIFAQKALDSVPRCEVYGKEYYRNYIMVFKQSTSAPSGFVASFAGVIDPAGNAIPDAQFSMDWR